VESVEAVTRDLRRRITKPEWPVGGQIDTFEQLQDRYPVLTNIYRIRQALAPLIHEGVLESRQGSGTWVRRIPSTAPTYGGLDGDVAQILADLDALRDRVVELQRRLAEPSIGVFSTTATGQR
jgi:DNA-binding GntR family transcriptional regulator